VKGNIMISLTSKVGRPARAAGLLLCFMLSARAASAKVTLVAKWGRFDQSFKSSIHYENPFQQCTLRVTFVSPSHETNEVFGFWDGGKIWRVRFSPDQPGRWTYRTACSDLANERLNDQTGEFLCTSPTGQSSFAQHGPVQITRDRRHFEYADGTPFFWMADAAWNAARLSSERDWITYTQVRAGESFSAVQWAAAPGMDAKNHAAYSGQNRITVDPEYFRALDEKVEMMNRAGLLSVIAPWWGSGVASDLPEDQTRLLVRYMTARWGAYDVAWLLTADEGEGARWLRIGRDVFGRRQHSPVIVFPGAMGSGFDDFQNENWVDAFGYGLGQNMNSDSLKWLVLGRVRSEWLKEPARPFLNVLPPLENGIAAQSQARISADDVRRLAWWSLLLTPTAGVSYGAQDVAAWNAAKQSKLPTWQLSLFLPGAKQMGQAAAFFTSVNYETLYPAPRSVAIQPGHGAPNRYIANAESAAKDLTVTYVPEDRTLELYLNALPASPGIQWLNPSTGQKSPAVAVVGTSTCQLPTPAAGDWVLVVKSGK
jgi:hypothetical protein